jgi:hypothetical protein
MIRGAQAAEGGLQGAGACSGPRGSPGQHARLWASRCRLLKRRSSIVGGRSIFSSFQHPPPENSMIRGAQASEGGLQGAGACSGPRGSPGQHARLWASRCRLLKRRSSIVGGRSIFSSFQHPPPENSIIRGAQAAERGLQGAGACSGPRGSPGQHARLWASRCRLLKRRSSIVGGRSIFLNFQHPPPENSIIRGAQAAEGGLQGAGACSGPRGSPGQHARLWVSRCRLLKRRSSIVGGRSIFSSFPHPPENSMIRGAQAAEGGLQGAGACSGPRGSPGQHARLWVSRCRLLKRRSSIVGGRSIFSNFPHPPENSMIRGAQAAEGGLQGAGACSGPRGSPGQHARLWASRCRLLKRRSSIVGGRSVFLNFQHPPGELDHPRCAGSGARTPGCRRLLGASGQPGAACAPLGKQMPALEAPVQHRRGEVDFLEFPTPPGELDDPRCAGSGGRTPGCRRLLGASGQPGAACASLGKQMPALEAPVQHRRGQVDFLEFPTHPGELDDPRCAGSGARTPGCRRLLGASGQPGAACAPLGKQMPALGAGPASSGGGRFSRIFNTPRRTRSSEVRRYRREDSRVQVPARGLGAARGSMRASGQADAGS